MACNLSPGNKKSIDVLATKNMGGTVFIQTKDSLVATVTNATLSDKNGKVDVPIDADGKMTLPELTEEDNLLLLILTGVDAGNKIELMEDCGGTTCFLKRKTVGRSPAGASPTLGFSIRAS